MKKQLLLTLVLIGAKQMHAVVQINSITDVQNGLNYIAKNVENKNISPGFLSTWKEIVDECMNYSIKNSTNYIGTEDKDIISAAKSVKYINTVIIPVYQKVYQDPASIKGYPALKEEFMSHIDYKAQDLRKLFNTIDSKTHSTAWRNNAKQALLKTITKLLHVLHQIKGSLYYIK
jgi:hypothetical protein